MHRNTSLGVTPRTAHVQAVKSKAPLLNIVVFDENEKVSGCHFHKVGVITSASDIGLNLGC